MKTLKPFPSARNTKPRAEVVFPFPSPVTTMIKPRRLLFMNHYSVRSCLAAMRSGALRCAPWLNPIPPRAGARAMADGKSADEVRLDLKPGASFRPPAIAPQPAEPPARPVSATGPARFLFHGKPARRFDPVARKLASGAMK